MEIERQQEEDRQTELAMDRLEKLRSLVAEFPLYKTIELPEFYPDDIAFLQNLTFNYQCEIDRSVQTFELSVYRPEYYMVADPFVKNEGQVLSHSEHFSAVCSKCKKYKMHFLIDAFGKKPKARTGAGLKQNSFFIRKIGQFPPYSKEPAKEVLGYLTKNDRDLYSKALMNLSTSCGLGAMAYFRRIVENEIKRMVQDLSEMSFDGASHVKEAFDKFQQDRRMANLIEAITPYAPQSLMIHGQNPIKLLYDVTSSGLHGKTEDECAEQAIQVDIILQFTIKQLTREKTEIDSVKNAMQKLIK